MRWRLISTLPDNTVNIEAPSQRCLMVLEMGGGLWLGPANRIGLRDFMRDSLKLSHQDLRGIYWRNLLPLEIARAWEVHKLVKLSPQWRAGYAGREEFAAKWIDALIHGGYGEAEGLRLIGEYAIRPGAAALEVVDVSDLPAPQWDTHRPAWRRSTNGGPIWIDEEKARSIDEARCWDAHA